MLVSPGQSRLQQKRFLGTETDRNGVLLYPQAALTLILKTVISRQNTAARFSSGIGSDNRAFPDLWARNT